MTNNVSKYLSSIAPFSYLSEETIHNIAPSINRSEYKKNTILFTQAVNKVANLYIIQKGALEIFSENGTKKTLQGFLGEGNTYGGISILLNEDFSVRTVRVHEDSILLQLPKKTFLALCKKNEEFSRFFTDTFGKRMLDKSYAALISRSIPENLDPGMSIFNERLSNIEIKKIPSCLSNTSIRDAASIMSLQKATALLVKESDNFIGIITDKDFREKVVVKSTSVEQPVSSIMSSPLITVNEDTTIFEALFFMIDNKIKHLVIKNNNQQVVGMVTDHDLVLEQGQSPLHLLQKVSTSAKVEDLFSLHSRLSQIVKVLFQNGARANIVNQFISQISDEILKKLVTFALKEFGPAPVPFVFMIMGSEGRQEQTLKTDQDNAIIYADVAKQEADLVHNYFLKLGKRVCGWLDKAGYTLCKGDVMAQNPKWCQPLNIWKNYFSTWIRTPEPQALMHASIFFDFRGAFGEIALVEKLQVHLSNLLSGNIELFYYHMAKNVLQLRPPLGFFRNFVVESYGKHKNAFDIKKGMTPIVDLTRLYALDNNIHENNTLKRLKELYSLDIFDKQEYEELTQAYTYLMQLRISRQLNSLLEEQKEADNYIIPKNLNHIEQRLLKEIFTLIEKFQQKMSIKFTAMA